ncbi:MAG: hypothetical protein LBN43_04215 [Oscillospiraceae bacterium]|nr:hypothetical protein [Oscillospiraceae bacterium]
MKIKQRLDTGLFFIVKENGELMKNARGIIYFADIRDAEKMVQHTKRHNTAFEGIEGQDYIAIPVYSESAPYEKIGERREYV